MGTHTDTAATHRITWLNPLTRRSLYLDGTHAEIIAKAHEIYATGQTSYRVELLDDIR